MTNGGGLAWMGGTLVFATEVGMLVGFGVWGFATLDGPVEWVAGVGLPLAVATFWGVFLAPKATRPAPEPVATVMRAGLFTTAAALLYAAGFHTWSFALVGVAVAGLVMSALWPLEVDTSPNRPPRR